MERKLIQQGKSGYTIYVPKNWIDKNELQKGDLINLEEEGNTIVIKVGQHTKKENKQTINVSNLYPLINRTILALYVKGVDELLIEFDDPKKLTPFQKNLIHELLGFEIIKQSHNSLLVKNITGDETQDLDDIIKRIFFILDSMVEELITSIENKYNLEPIIEIDTSINRFVNFCHRVLHKQGYKDFKKTPYIYSITFSLEKIGDIYKEIAQHLKEQKKLTTDQLLAIKKTKESLKIFKETLFDFDREKTVDFANNYENIKKKIKGANKIDSYLTQLNDTIVTMVNQLLIISI